MSDAIVRAVITETSTTHALNDSGFDRNYGNVTLNSTIQVISYLLASNRSEHVQDKYMSSVSFLCDPLFTAYSYMVLPK